MIRFISVLIFLVAFLFGCQTTKNEPNPQKTSKSQIKEIEFVTIESPSTNAGSELGVNDDDKRKVLNTKLSKLYSLLTLSTWQLEAAERKRVEDNIKDFTSALASGNEKRKSEERIALYRKQQAEIMAAANKLAENVHPQSYDGVIMVLDDYIKSAVKDPTKYE